jgi:hypothetical protein
LQVQRSDVRMPVWFCCHGPTQISWLTAVRPQREHVDEYPVAPMMSHLIVGPSNLCSHGPLGQAHLHFSVCGPQQRTCTPSLVCLMSDT